jgi:phenylalanyl-tRNA synthetase alpha chain
VRERIESLRGEALAAIEAAASGEALAAIERRFLGREGELTRILALLPTLSREERPAAGAAANRFKEDLLLALERRRRDLEERAVETERRAVHFDPTLPGRAFRLGSLHPITTVARELEDLFTSMGFAVVDGPEVELEHYNFDAINIPPDHPARDVWDTFWCEGTAGLLLRTHTSPVQVRAMERLSPPLRVLVPGRCFRHEAVDASHEHTFHQVEGLVVDRGISVAHMIGTLRTLLRGIFERDLEVRLRPGYFPFVEPGFELDARCPFCGAKGCSVCKHTGWVEILPCGLVHPNVLRAGGLDPEEVSGFAFGLGLSRLVMLRYGIDDIRWFFGGDLRFLRQF